MYWFFTGKTIAPVYQFCTLGTLMNQVCHVWWAFWTVSCNMGHQQPVCSDAE